MFLFTDGLKYVKASLWMNINVILSSQGSWVAIHKTKQILNRHFTNYLYYDFFCQVQSVTIL